MAEQGENEFGLDDVENLEREIEAELEAEAEAEETEEFDAPEADEYAVLLQERDELKDRLLRSLADSENIRKRAMRERAEAEVYGGTKLARDMLSVYDNFSRALESITPELRESQPALVEGIELTQKDLVNVFEKHKIFVINPEIGSLFDPKLHEAMFEAPVPNTKKGDIIQVMNVGFMIGERLLRAAQVGVSSTV